MFWRCGNNPPCSCAENEKSGGSRVPLCDLKDGCRVKVACIEGGRALCARMAALGIYPGAEMHLLCSGCGHPCLVRVNGGTVSIGKGISEKIMVTPSA